MENTNLENELNQNIQQYKVHLSIQLDLSDMTRYSRYMFLSSVAGQVISILSILFVIFCVFMIITYWNSTFFLNPANCFFLSMPALAVLWRWFSIPLYATKEWERSELLQEKKEWIFSTEQMAYKSELSEGRLSWNSILKAAESKYDFYLFISNNQAFLIPKKFFSNQIEQQYFRKILQNQLVNKFKTPNQNSKQSLEDN